MTEAKEWKHRLILITILTVIWNLSNWSVKMKKKSQFLKSSILELVQTIFQRDSNQMKKLNLILVKTKLLFQKVKFHKKKRKYHLKFTLLWTKTKRSKTYILLRLNRLVIQKFLQAKMNRTQHICTFKIRKILTKYKKICWSQNWVKIVCCKIIRKIEV